MATNYYKQVVDLLRQHGFEFTRQGKGSHELWASAGQGIKVTVPRNLKSRHTANGILKDAGCDAKL